ncbi:MAG: tetratricopeptide repeat protein, partial [Phycisphaerales bacterium]|nr:tetratricopeptide repeat protein [Phycisphaerales bacterium]
LTRIRRRGIAYLGVVSTWFVLVYTRVAVGVLSTSHPTATAGFSYKGVSPLTYLLTQTEILLHNLRLIVWPTGLSIDYNWPPVAGLSDVLVPSAIALFLCVLVIIVYIRAPQIGVIPAMFFVILIPTSTIVPIKDLANDHRLYLASFGVIATIALVIWMSLPALAKLFPKRGVQVVAGALAVVCIGSLVYATHERAALYANELDLWRDVLVRNPDNPRALFRIGKEHEEEGRFAEAEACFRRAIDGWPDYTEAHLELAGRLRADGKNADAIVHYEKALEYRRSGQPKMTAIALFGLTQALLAEGQNNAASRTIEEALTYDDSRADMWMLAGAMRFRREDLAEAVEAYEHAARLEPMNPVIFHDLGMLFERMDKVKDSERALRHTIELDPGYTDAYYQLGIVRQRKQDLKEAAELYQKTLDLEPDHERARQRLRSLQGTDH